MKFQTAIVPFLWFYHPQSKLLHLGLTHITANSKTSRCKIEFVSMRHNNLDM